MPNIFDSECDAIVNPTNPQGVMGGGLAGQFAQRYPEMLEWYKRQCTDGTHKIGEVQLYRTQFNLDHPGGPTNKVRSVIVNFPTMDLGHPAKLEDIKSGLEHLRMILQTQSDDLPPEVKITSIAIPPLGCGIGRLNWDEVEPLIREALGDLEDIQVDLYPPDGAVYSL